MTDNGSRRFDPGKRMSPSPPGEAEVRPDEANQDAAPWSDENIAHSPPHPSIIFMNEHRWQYGKSGRREPEKRPVRLDTQNLGVVSAVIGVAVALALAGLASNNDLPDRDGSNREKSAYDNYSPPPFHYYDSHNRDYSGYGRNGSTSTYGGIPSANYTDPTKPGYVGPGGTNTRDTYGRTTLSNDEVNRINNRSRSSDPMNRVINRTGSNDPMERYNSRPSNPLTREPRTSPGGYQQPNSRPSPSPFSPPSYRPPSTPSYSPPSPPSYTPPSPSRPW